MDRVGVSLNLTNGVSRFLPDAEFGAFDTALWVCAGMVVMEIVYWSPPFNGWVYLVREHTRRVMPEGAREITVDELPYYEQQLSAAR